MERYVWPKQKGWKHNETSSEGSFAWLLVDRSQINTLSSFVFCSVLFSLAPCAWDKSIDDLLRLEPRRDWSNTRMSSIHNHQCHGWNYRCCTHAGRALQAVNVPTKKKNKSNLTSDEFVVSQCSPPLDRATRERKGERGKTRIDLTRSPTVASMTTVHSCVKRLDH